MGKCRTYWQTDESKKGATNLVATSCSRRMEMLEQALEDALGILETVDKLTLSLLSTDELTNIRRARRLLGGHNAYETCGKVTEGAAVD